MNYVVMQYLSFSRIKGESCTPRQIQALCGKCKNWQQEMKKDLLSISKSLDPEKEKYNNEQNNRRSTKEECRNILNRSVMVTFISYS